MRKLLLTIGMPLVLLLLSLATFAQTRTITGRVTDATGKGISGVSVTVKGSTAGTVTGDNGNYTITVPANVTALVFTSVGYAPIEMTLGANNSLDVSLQSTAANLNEVVVIGYGTRQRKDLTGSVTTINAREFNKGQVTTPEQLIAGKVAGVQITSNSGRPGSGSTIRIRGGASLSASNDPLIVLDGVPLEGRTVRGESYPLAAINPQDIESFNILKDASATAIYGSRASNGVIIITTKKGRSGRPSFNFSSQVSMQTNPKQVDVLSAAELRDVLNKSGNTAAIALLGTANTNWQDQIYQNALSQDINLGVTGAMGWLPYRASVGFLNQDGVLKTDNMKRTSASLTLSPNFLENHLKVNLNLKGTFSKYRYANTDAIGNAIVFDPTKPVRTGNRFGGFFEWVDPGTNIPSTLSPRNPVSLLENTDIRSNIFRSIGNLQLDYALHFLPDLHANLNVGYDITVGKEDQSYPDSLGNNYTSGGYRSQFRETKNLRTKSVDTSGNWFSNKDGINEKPTIPLLEAFLSYNKDLAFLKSRIDAVAGYSYQNFLTTRYSFPGVSYTGRQTSPNPVYPFNEQENTLISFFGRMNYSLMNKYLITASLRRDGSSRFSPENRWGWFPAAAFAWRLKEEDFLKSSSTFSDLKLRLGYGITGQQDIGLNYGYLGLYTLSNNSASYQLGNTYYNMYRPAGYNPNLKWEETKTYNAGLDFGFVGNRVNGTVDVYLKKTTDLLNNINQPAGANFSNIILANIGNMENRGIEFNLNTNPVRTKDFRWDANFNITYNKNKITKLTAVDDPEYPGVQFGGISGGINNTLLINSVGNNRGAFYVYQQVYDQAGKPLEGIYVDRNSDGVINQKDLYRYKSSDPSLFGGFSSNLSYKQWNGGFTIRGSYGNYMYNNVYSNLGASRNVYNIANILNNASVDFLNTRFNNNQYLSDYYLSNASFLRMDNIYVGYDLGTFGGSRTRASLNASVQNVFVVTEYKGLDPEILGGIDNSFYPRPRVFALGLNVNF